MSRYNRNGGGSDFLLKQTQVTEVSANADIKRAQKFEKEGSNPYG